MKLFTPERIYAFVMIIISLVLAGFLTNLGGLVIADLPRVEENIKLESFIDQGAQNLADETKAQLSSQRSFLLSSKTTTQRSLQDANRAYEIGSQAFKSWAETRSTTGDSNQNDELLRRSNQLDILRNKLADEETKLADIDAELSAINQQQAKLQREEQQRFAAARPAFEQATFMQEARVFAFRLAFTLPLILLSIWLIKTKTKSRYWPLYRGFVIFALLAFFVELVPYLPSYGGYIRYIIGITLTLLAGMYLVKWMRGYLEERKRERLISEKERRERLDYDTAVKKAGKEICPSCERSIEKMDGVDSDFCAQCGLMLYENCNNCETRKLVFHHYCLKCGVKANNA